MKFNSCVYRGHVYHRRFRPVPHSLRYRVFSLLLDISELDELSRRLWLFSRNRFNLLSFHDRDFGEGPDETLEQYVSRLLAESGLHTPAARVLLSCYPRVLGVGFNPLSLFYCLNRSGQVFAVIHEVHNTFGERHAYVLPVAEGSAPDDSSRSDNGWINQHADKVLFVSPFNSMDMQYAFRLNVPGKRQVIAITTSDHEGRLLTASYTASRQPMQASTLLRSFVSVPVLGIKVIAGIHWEAFRLWVKRVPLVPHQAKTITHSIKNKNV